MKPNSRFEAAYYFVPGMHIEATSHIEAVTKSEATSQAEAASHFGIAKVA